MKRAWWLIGGAFVVGLAVAATQYHRIDDANKPIGERIDQPAGGRLAGRQDTSSDKSTEDARPDNSTKAARLNEPSEDARAREIAGPTAPLALTTEQRDKIRGQVAGPREARVDTSEFKPTLGTIVPPHVLLHHLPAELADIMGGYHGSDYLIVRDQLVIVDPNVRRIVAVVPGV
jgi:uncharacterized protein DUF1236